MIYIIVLLLLSSLISRAVTLNILVWSTTIGHSHVKFMGHIADTLREDGHNITLLMIRNDPDVVITGTKLVEHILWRVLIDTAL
uniref:Glucuronosyltransferase n=1 Tax=Heterorhabditis bacteriophora TaxID=37862 RepID=A0A1I7XJN1_HETBA